MYVMLSTFNRSLIKNTYYRYHRNRENHRKHPYLKAVTDDLLDLNEDFNLIAEDQEITMHGMAEKETVGEVKETSNLEEEYDTITYSLYDDITFESNQAQNISETIEKNVTINTPQNNVEELVTLKLDNFNELMSENSTLIKRKSSEEIIAKPKKNKNETILNKEENEMDDNTPDIKASKLVTVLSAVKIKNKDIDSKIKSKAVNISSDDLSNSDLFD
ncbi:hypothetical protein ABMA28_011908 [Loxostege sticticalis]|uniref:Uncharacterized protein n=2 Tax=Loxostege sticticalis TaxID=481309 RepID=A0ABD0TL65_LOXSC